MAKQIEKVERSLEDVKMGQEDVRTGLEDLDMDVKIGFNKLEQQIKDVRVKMHAPRGFNKCVVC